MSTFLFKFTVFPHGNGIQECFEMSATLENTMFWHVTPTFRRNIFVCHLQIGRLGHLAARMEYALRNVGEFIPDHTASHPTVR
jgi:hypothetical protein